MAKLTPAQALDLAVQNHQGGRLREAAGFYQQVLARQPNHPDALHLLGVLMAQQGQIDSAVNLIERSIRQRPDFAEAYGNLANALKLQGKLDQAVGTLRKSIKLDATRAATFSTLGAVLKEQGQLDEAIAACRQAIALDGEHGAAYCNLGDALLEKGEVEDAIAACRQAVALLPGSYQAHNNLGNALLKTKDFDGAIAALERSIELNGNVAQSHSNLGNALKSKGELEAAIAAHRRAIALAPNLAQAFYNLGTALEDSALLEQAADAYRQAMSLDDRYADAFAALAQVHEKLSRPQEAQKCFERGLAIAPDNQKLHMALAFSLLSHGDLPRGWQEYEWRWADKENPPRPFKVPMWDGASLQGRTILVHCEQGSGDVIHFARYVPLLVQRAGRVIFECDRSLHRLFGRMPEACQVVETEAFSGGFDVHCPLLSLPRLFGTTLETIPAQVPYLHAQSKDVERWQRRLAADDKMLKVGLIWAGNPAYPNDRYRSIPLPMFAPLAQVSGVHFLGLQKEGSARAQPRPAGLQLTDWMDESTDFADTAALMANLDLVISVDTAMAHLAGALGKPVWTLLAASPDWRWLRQRNDSPWYPTMRLFRQTKLEKWEPTIETVAAALNAFVAEKLH